MKQLKNSLVETRDSVGNFRLSLKENEHVEWSLLKKIARVGDSLIYSREWPTVETKVRVICSEAVSGQLRGLPAAELLSVGGQKHLMWVDIDAGGPDVSRWIKEQKIFPKNSFVEVTSTTGNVHLYVATDKPLIERWQPGMRSYIAKTMPQSITYKMDRVYGPKSRRCIFVPTDGLSGGGRIPQELCAELTEVYTLPVDAIEAPAWRFI